MKIKLGKKYFQIGLTIFFTAIAILFVVFFIWKNESIRKFFDILNSAIRPVFYGLIISYLLSPILNFVERKALIPLFHKLKWFEPDKDKKRDKHIRAFSIVITLLIVFAFLYFFFASVIPEIKKSIQSIIAQYPTYTKNLMNWINKFVENNPDLKDFTNQFIVSASVETDNWLNDMVLPFVQKLIPNIGDMLLNLSTSLIKFVTFLWNIVIGLIISIYVLGSKERFANHCTRLCYAFLETKNANKFIESVRFTHRTFIGFLSGKIVDSIVIGMICFIVTTIMGLPYTILISIIVGVTNIIPFFGPLFGAIPSAFILLMVNPKFALYFIIFIIILQQFDGNFLGPKILSQTTGITTFWIITSITIFSSLFGVVGMILAVPVSAILYALLTNVSNYLLAKKNLPTDLESYKDVGSITESGEIIIYENPADNKPKEESKMLKAIGRFFAKIGSWFKNLFKKNK